MTVNCHDCDRPLATQEDWDSTPDGGGEKLCWRAWNVDTCLHPSIDWRKRALAAEAEVSRIQPIVDAATAALAHHFTTPGQAEQSRLDIEIDRAVDGAADNIAVQQVACSSSSAYSGTELVGLVSGWLTDNPDKQRFTLTRMQLASMLATMLVPVDGTGLDPHRKE